HKPTCAGAEPWVAPLAMFANEAVACVITTFALPLESVAVTPVAAASPMFWRLTETTASSPASRIPLPLPPPPPAQESDWTALETNRASAPQELGAIAFVIATSSR